ncbi:MAG: methionyl-tRNA formyltransferase [Candidatus Hydrogenedentes bacterium]|nr:methionyl-tRNA formyltransferase [Candidatus Hydrogenedentota bacterium]
MRIVFFGTPEMAVPSLAALAEKHEVAAVVCQPDRPSGRGKSLTPPPTKIWALAHGIPVTQPAKLNDGTFETWLRDQHPEVCALTAYGRILKQPILDVAPHGILNMHPSLLPLYRGPSPIQSALINGETETGVTIMRLSLDMDAGDILIQEHTAIDPEETGETLTNRLATLGGQKLCEAVDRIAAGPAQFKTQDHSRATYCSLIEKRDGQIDWTKSAQTIHNLVRGAQPWPTAQTIFEGQVFKILRSEIIAHANKDFAAQPGAIEDVLKDRIVVRAGEDSLALLTVQAPGKRAMPVGDFLRGFPIKAGQRFESFS